MEIVKRIKKYKQNHTSMETIKWLSNAALFRVKRLKRKPNNYYDVKIKEINDVVLKETHQVFIFASVPFYDIGGGQRSAQLARTFNKLGFRVYYIYAFQSYESNIYKIDMPLIMHQHINKLSTEYMDNFIKKDDLIIFEAPVEMFYPYVELALEKEAYVVYENIDNWETSLGNRFLKKSVLYKMVRFSHILVGSAKPLVKQLEEYAKEINENKKMLYLANAVDDEVFSPMVNYDKPKDLKIGEKTLIYYGSLWGSWFDWDLIKKLALKHPEYSFNMIGDTQNILDLMKTLPKNIYFLGLKKQADLPAYLKYSDYAMIPFKIDEIGEYVSPLKIFEYISMGKRVLCTKLPDIEGYPNTFLGNTAEEWEKYIEQDIAVDKISASEFILNNNWFSRVISLIEEVYPQNVKKCPDEYYKNISIVVLNHNNLNVIGKCIDSLLMFNERYRYEIIVVDNASSDGSYEYLEKRYKGKINLVKNKKNGCSSGRNLGVKNAKGQFILFLDSDQWVMNEYFLDSYFDVLKQKKNVGLIGWAAGWFNDQSESYRVVDSYPNRYMYPNALARSDIGYLGAGGMLISKKLFAKIKGFDVHYDPTCYEDTDLSLKVRNAGYEIYYCPYLGVMHLPHQTTKDGSDAHIKLTQEKYEYFKKKKKEKNPNLLKYIKK